MSAAKPVSGRRRMGKIALWGLLLLIVGLTAWWFATPPPPPPNRLSGQHMKAIVYHDYGTADVLRYEDVGKPIPNDDELLVKVRAASVNPLDWHYMRGTPYIVRLGDTGIFKPNDVRLGTDVAGVVEAVGHKVTLFKAGDEVFGTSGGAFADFAVVRETRAALKPANITFEQAAAVPIAAVTALQALRDKGHLQPTQAVLINGASGGVGTFAVQIAKSSGAEVTAVCSTRNIDLVRSIGADHAIDYTKEDFTLGTPRYDLVIDTVGNRPVSAIRRVMKPTGVYVGIGGGGPDDGAWIGPLWGLLKVLLYSHFVPQKFVPMMADVTQHDLNILKDLMAAKKVTPVIDRTFPLPDVPAAMRYSEQGHARGKVVITVAQDN